MAEDLEDTIAARAAGPASVAIDGVSTTEQSLHDLIEADKHLGRKAARRNPAGQLTIMRIVPPGAV